MIEVQDLWKSYGGFHALLGINFTVNRGEIVGFCGPNGAGQDDVHEDPDGIHAAVARARCASAASTSSSTRSRRGA